MVRTFLVKGANRHQDMKLNLYQYLFVIDGDNVILRSNVGDFLLCGSDLNSEDYYTASEVDGLLDQLSAGNLDLSNYYTKAQVDSLVGMLNSEMEAIDLSNYYSKSEIGDMLQQASVVNLEQFYIKTEIDSKLSLKVDKSTFDALDIPSITGLATETYVDNAILNIPAPDLTLYSKVSDVNSAISTAIAQAQLDGGDVDLSAYSNTIEMNSAISTAIASIPDVDLTTYETITSNTSKLTLKADKTEVEAVEAKVDALVIPSIDGLATETYVDDAIAAIPAPNLSTFETIVSNDAKLALKADKTEVSSAVNTAVSNLVNGAPETFNTLKEIADWIEGDGVNVTELSTAIVGKADKTELIGLATETYVDDAIADIEIEVDLSEYETIVTNDSKLSLKADKTQLDGLATEEFVTNETLNKVDKVVGKGLSTEDYTTSDKNKLATMSILTLTENLSEEDKLQIRENLGLANIMTDVSGYDLKLID